MLLSKDNIDINIHKKQSIKWYFRSRSNGAMFGYLSFDERKERTQEKSILYIAVEKQNIELITLLLSYEKLDINLPNNFYSLWIKYPVYFNEYDYYNEYAQRNMKTRYNIEKKSMTVLHLAITTENVEIVKLLLSNTNINVNLLFNKSKINKNDVKGHVELVHDEGETSPAFDRKFDDNDECVNWTQVKEQTELKNPLYLAVERKKIEICKVLLSNADIDINLHSTNSMIKKIDNREEDENEVEDEYNNSYRNNDEEEEEKEEEEENEDDYNDEKEEVDDDGVIKIWKNKERTPLHLAVKIENTEIIQLLLNNKKIDVNSKDENKKTPIEYTNDEKIKELFNV